MGWSWLRGAPSGPLVPSLLCASLLFTAYSVFNQRNSFQEEIEDNIIPSTTNRTADGLVLVYNRVPKCSSTSMYKLIKTLSLRNHFKFTLAKSDDIRNELRSQRKEKALVAAVKALPKHAVYVRHVYNPDWKRLGVKVNLVNMIRDPISRMASWFYFVRSPAAKNSLGRYSLEGRPKPSWRQKTFDSCVMTGDPECQMGGNRSELLLSYFCGYGPGCSDPEDASALQRAKAAVEEQYSVVGVVEMRNVSLAVMEAYLPQWFRHTTALQEKEEKREMVNSHPEPGRHTRTELMRRLRLDYNFYHFCMQRLELQSKTIQKK